MNKRQTISIAVVIAIGVVLGGLILTWDKTSPSTPRTKYRAAESCHDTKDHHQPGIKRYGASNTDTEPGKGPKGGKLFTSDGFGVEVTIFEKGVPPQFRLYLYENGKPLPPAAAKVTVTLSRLGAPAQIFKFKPEADYLLGDQVVEEPHSFDVAITAESQW